MYVETTIKIKRAQRVMRCIFGLRGLPMASKGDEMTGRVMVDDIGNGEAKDIGMNEERLFARRCTML
jgi:hypothetical protein